MTFSEAKRAFRTLRRVAAAVRAVVNNMALQDPRIDDLVFTIPQQDFEDCQWALARVKQWVRDVDETTGDLLPSGRYVRMNFLHVKTSEPRPRFLLKYCPVTYDSRPPGEPPLIVDPIRRLGVLTGLSVGSGGA